MENINKHAEIIFNFLSKQYINKSPDFILVLGSGDLRVAKFASEYYKKNPTNYVIVSGGLGKTTKEMWKVSEAKKFSQIMIKNGVPKEIIYLDEKATNTGENILNAKKIITDNNLKKESGVLITKPYMTKRAFNTASKQWSEVKWSSIAEKSSYIEYLNNIDDKERFINVMVGDLQRIKVYGEMGFQIEEEIPLNVWNSFELLSDNGYNKFVIK